ncbi:MAG: redoxin domain-containing protein [Candidatus Spechtbacteria bacterium]|nr:redoxin domain-containing protein [Candidatus Spechtbacteria bacterium]
MSKQKIIIFVAALVLIVGSIVYLESRKAGTARPSSVDENSTIVLGGVSGKEAQARIAEKSKKYELAKEISTPDGFINTDSITIAELIGKKIILVDFWTYSCINCQRTTPYLNAWYEKYADKGLVILGVHTPEFDFEKDYDNVKRATAKFRIQYPVILDNDYSTWNAYKNRYWPRKYLIDIDGFVVYDHIGEGGYQETEEKIVELLNERSEVLGEKEIVMDDTAPENVDATDFSKVGTPETYLGYGRLQYIANLPSRDCFDKDCVYITPEKINLNTFALSGIWNIHSEQVTATAEDGAIIIGFSANKVNLVAGGKEGKNVRAEILLDGKRIEESSRGAQVVDGFVTFNTYDLYNLVDLKGNYGEHVLIIKVLDPGLQAFAFTFG